jgi:predicted RNA binding protein YcfA (HicA-like mRNA interferase family)
MARTPQVSGKEVVKVLTRSGFVVVSQSGSHIKLKRKQENHTRTVIVPNHRAVRKGTFHNILRMAGLSLDDFRDMR